MKHPDCPSGSTKLATRGRSESPRGLLLCVCVLACLLALIWQRGLDMRRAGRASLASTVARRLTRDAELLEGDKDRWYRVEADRIGSAELRDKFVRGEEDEETRSFVERSVDKSGWLFTQLWHNLAKGVLTLLGYSQTDANGMLGRGSMFVISERHLLQMLRAAGKGGEGWSPEEPSGSLVDLGAGDGTPLERIRKYFRINYATEASPAMRAALRRTGVQLLEVDTWHTEHDGDGFDLVACLNLLDRCERPLSVLSQIRDSLSPRGGLALVAVVLPFVPFVEFPSSSGDRRPAEALTVSGSGFEAQAESLASLLEAEGFEVLSWTRVPYLCEGDLANSVYVLDDAVFLLRPAKADRDLDRPTSKR